MYGGCRLLPLLVASSEAQRTGRWSVHSIVIHSTRLDWRRSSIVIRARLTSEFDCRRSSIVVALRASTESSLSDLLCAALWKAHISRSARARYVRPSQWRASFASVDRAIA